ncbi:helix-turn-helix domain-containing protein [Actinomadura scrupuli]|uniref:helix-turn-helix domain-containing protein n=1 Tax=Actinomadura scrupuli TaxID=559629 RepID=UPI003D989C24
MADSARLTVRRRRLGRELRRIREELGWTQAKAARLMDRPASSLAKIERAEQGLRQDELHAILDAYRVADPQLRRFLLTLRRDASKRGWWNRYKNTLSPATLDLISLEADAKVIRTFEALYLPGLLQTEAYMRAMLGVSVSGLRPSDQDEFVAVRLKRQEILTCSRPPQYSLIIGEAALRQMVGGPQTMSDQLSRVLEMAEFGHVKVRVLPFSAGANPGMNGAFTILEVGEWGELTVARVEALTRAWYLEDGDDLRRYSLAYDQLSSVALSEWDSRALIECVRSAL